jgi:HAD superfamily hydrolase (TIGR01509 family)
MPIIEAIVFDLDGLMVDSEPLAKEAWRAFLARHGHTFDRETSKATLGLRLTECAQLIKERYDLPLSVEEIAAQRSEWFLAALEGNLQPMPGLLELLEAIDARGLRRAVATSSPKFYASAALREIGVAGGFEVIIAGDMVPRGKPAPDIYLAAAEALALSPAVCLALEDSPNGLHAAKSAGMRCIVVPNALSADLDLSAADHVLPSLSIVAERLDELVSW